MWLAAKKGLAIFFLKAPRNDEQARAAIKLYKDEVREPKVKQQFVAEYPAI